MQTRDDANMILTPRRWPAWPLLPLKRPTSGLSDVAVLTEHHDDAGNIVPGQFRLYEHVNMWMFPISEKTGEEIMPRIVSVDDVLAAGWEVD